MVPTPICSIVAGSVVDPCHFGMGRVTLVTFKMPTKIFLIIMYRTVLVEGKFTVFFKDKKS
jgi:hypothetical protein